jgi:hypothetical protein
VAFVTPGDIRWMLRLTAPRIKITMAFQHRKLGLNAGIIKRSNAALKKALKGGNNLTRQQLTIVLQKAGIATNETRLIHLMATAELDEIVCSGPKPESNLPMLCSMNAHRMLEFLKRDEALKELVLRYF